MTKREVVLDTETTGLDHKHDRIVEIGCVELIDGVPTGRTYQRYVDPLIAISPASTAIHGIDAEKLKAENAQIFAAIADEFLEFIGDAPIVMHNASFDLAFLNAELRGCGRPTIAKRRSVDTLALAKEKFPAKQASLDALCRRFGIAAHGRHSAMKDAELLAQVYIELQGGRQRTMAIEVERKVRMLDGISPAEWKPKLVFPSDEELAAHDAFMASIARDTKAVRP